MGRLRVSPSRTQKCMISEVGIGQRDYSKYFSPVNNAAYSELATERRPIRVVYICPSMVLSNRDNGKSKLSAYESLLLQ